jgi:amidohydrolase
MPQPVTAWQGKLKCPLQTDAERACDCRANAVNLVRAKVGGTMLSESDLNWLANVRHHLHQHPELSCDEATTSAYIAERLAELGIPAVTGIGGYGVVATLQGHGNGPAVGLRADMDALAITERTDLPYSSKNPGVMHACGHDGHMTILLGAAMILKRSNFAGQVHLIFQPAEEKVGGARLMLADGLFQRFPMQQIFGLHNWPGLHAGQVVLHDGPVMAGTSEFALRFTAAGGHASMPHLTGDPLLAGGHFMTGIQQAVARSVDPLESAVVTVGTFHGGSAQNIIPQGADLTGTLRAFRTETLLHLQDRVRSVAKGAAEMAGCGVDLNFDAVLCRPVVNTPTERDIMRNAALGAGLRLGDPMAPSMGGDDFGEFLHLLPGAYAFLGNGERADENGLHQPKYDFNDAIIAPGAMLLANSALVALGQS